MPTTTLYNRGAVILLPYPSDDLLVVAVTSIGNELRPGEFAIQRWREAGLLHPSFVKRAITSVSGNLVRRQIGQLNEEDLANLDGALRLWCGLSSPGK
jgi:hypothetical protein